GRSRGGGVIKRRRGGGGPPRPGPESLRIVPQTGPAARDEVAEAYHAAGRKAEVLPFLDDMESRFAQADLVLCRSGATTAAELAAAGQASVLGPFPGAPAD